jgi:hypothetical protein
MLKQGTLAQVDPAVLGAKVNHDAFDLIAHTLVETDKWRRDLQRRVKGAA